MKFDKDTVIKHHFWFLLATAAPLALVALVFLATAVASTISKSREELKTALDGNKVADPAKNDEWIKEIKVRVAKTQKREEEVWLKAYNEQKDLFTWPYLVEQNFAFKDGLFAIEIKGDSKAPAADSSKPADSKDEGKVIKQFSGRIEAIEVAGKDLPVVMKVSNGKEMRFFRPTQKIKLTRDGKGINSFVNFDKGDQVTITYYQGKYFNDPLTEAEQLMFGKGEKGYRTQIDDILNSVQPMTRIAGELSGVVQLRLGTGVWYRSFKNNQPILPPENAPFLRYVAGDASGDWNTDGDISEEAWIAQEDLWIQRELYRLIRQSNDMVSVMEGKGGNELNKWYEFKNPYWKLELIHTGERKLTAKITNLLPRRQKLDLNFMVRIQDSKTAKQIPINIPGEPIDPNKQLTKDIAVGVDPKGIFGVEQVIDWQTAAVKRIDQITIASQTTDCCLSNRLFPDGLTPFKKPAAAPGAENKDQPTGRPGFGRAEQGGTTRNGLSPDRYFVLPPDKEPAPQVRRVPFGITLIVDQAHLDRVLYAFSKSHLRILMTQVIVNHYPHSLRPPEPQGGVASAPSANAPKARPQDDRRFGLRVPGGFGNLRTPGGNAGPSPRPAAAAAVDDGQEINMELVIYGIASLYQRYPPRPKTP